VFVDGIKTLEELQLYATDLADLPRMYNGDLAPTQEVAALGYRLMICGSTIWLVYKLVRDAFEELQRAGRVNPERHGRAGARQHRPGASGAASPGACPRVGTRPSMPPTSPA
jgi:hypothetical protein